jgi:hypothetical protein
MRFEPVTSRIQVQLYRSEKREGGKRNGESERNGVKKYALHKIDCREFEIKFMQRQWKEITGG